VLIAQGDQVIPTTTIELSLELEDPASCNIAGYEWALIAPKSSCATLAPNGQVSNPTAKLDLVGDYQVFGGVTDLNGKSSCVKGSSQVVVIPDDHIYVELVWNTPMDEDQCDQGPEAGADVDLHFVHPFAGGDDVDGDGEPDGWFDQLYDCNWFNTKPNWGSQDPQVDDDPSLLLDDTDGTGPEAIVFNGDAPLSYKIGVHYWNDHEYGTSDATVKVYYMGTEVYETQPTPLVQHDMWEVGQVDGATGEVDPSEAEDGGPKITEDYESPF